MALTVTTGPHGITILFDWSTPLEYNDEAPSGLAIESLTFKPAATDDICIVREGGIAGGRQILNEKAKDIYDSKTKYFNTEKGGKLYKPYIVGAECTTGATLIIEFK